MKRLSDLFSSWTSPAGVSPEKGLRYWQEKVLLTLLLVAVSFGFLVYIPSVLLSIKESLWVVAAADTAIYAFTVFVFFSSAPSYQTKAASFSGLCYLLGMILLLVLGPFGAGPVWLFAFPVVTCLLLGMRSALFALLINTATVVLLGVLALFGIYQWGDTAINPMAKWIVVSLNFMLLNTMVTLCVSTMLKGLQKSLVVSSESERKYRRIYENLQDVYVETSIQGNLLEVSPSIERYSKYRRQELLGKPLVELYRNPAERNVFLEKLFEKQRINGYELTLTDKDGSLHLFSINASLLKDDDGNPCGIVGMCRDITEQRAVEITKQKLEEQLNRSRKMEALGLLAGGVAHDLNNILSGTVGYPDLIMMDLPDASPLRPSLTAIRDSGQKAAAIVQDLLTLSRRGVTNRKVIDLNTIIMEFLDSPECRKILEHHPGVTITTDLCPGPARILGSPVHLGKTVMNLISNAAEAMPEGGTIRVATAIETLENPGTVFGALKPGDHVRLTMEDTGIGIADHDLDRIFEPFFTKKVMGRSGTGLGMAVVWGTVQDHAGHIDVTSTPGQGTTFTLYFPLTRLAQENQHTRLTVHDVKGRGETILVIDDRDDQRDVTLSMLERLNYRARPAASGEKALELIRQEPADLVILDMIMDPGIDGLDTYRRMLEINPRQKAIIASGFSETDRVRQAQELGAGGYLKKPFTLQQLGEAVKLALAQNRESSGDVGN